MEKNFGISTTENVSAGWEGVKMVEPISKHTLRKMAEYGERRALSDAMMNAGISPSRMELQEREILMHILELKRLAAILAKVTNEIRPDQSLQAIFAEVEGRYGRGWRAKIEHAIRNAEWPKEEESDAD